MTVKEIKAKLDELGIEYKDKMRKDELLSLLPEESEEENPKTYVVIRGFKDLKDNDHIYEKGDTFPRDSNMDVSQNRIDELMTKKNKIGKHLIREQE